MTRPRPNALLLLLLPLSLPAQLLFDASSPNGRPVREAFDRTFDDRSLPRLDCTVRPIPARLSFDLRIFAGFEATLAYPQSQGARRPVLLNVFRVTPRKPAGEPRWFVRRWPLPAPPADARPNPRLQAQLGGGFLVGPGRYDIDWLVIDAQDRVCRKSWRLNVRESRAAELGIAPGTVEDDRRLLDWPGPSAATGRSATILLHAAPTLRRRYSARLSWWDRRLLLTTLTNTIDRGGFSSARLLVFDLERRRILFESDSFQARDYRRLNELLSDVELATIDYQTLASGPSEWEFLSSLLLAELERPASPPDALIFLTPAWREGPPKGRLDESLRAALPPLFSLALAPYGRFAFGSVVDLTRAARGRVLNVFFPPDLASATARLRRELDSPSR